MALARAVDAVGPVQAGVEPLRRVRRGDLGGEHVAHLVVEGLRVLLGVEVLALPAPVGPRAGEAVEDLRGGHLAAVALLLRQRLQRLLVGDRAPQEGGDVVLLDLLQAGGDAGLAEIFLGDDVARHLAPRRGHVDAVEAEDDRAVRVSDFALGLPEFDSRVRRLSCCRVAPLDPHLFSPIDADNTSARGRSPASPHTCPTVPERCAPVVPGSSLSAAPDCFSWDDGYGENVRRRGAVVKGLCAAKPPTQHLVSVAAGLGVVGISRQVSDESARSRKGQRGRL